MNLSSPMVPCSPECVERRRHSKQAFDALKRGLARQDETIAMLSADNYTLRAALAESRRKLFKAAR